MKELYQVEEQRIRNQKIFEQYTEEACKKFGTEEYCKTYDNANVRMFEKLNQCIPFFASNREDARIEANRLLRKQTMEFCQFTPLLCLEMLANYRDKIDEDNIVKLEAYVRDILDEFKEDDLDFVGVNDNFPCIATYIVLMGGKMFHRPEIYAVGVKRLQQLGRMLRRRGCISEYNSPSYIAGQISAIALIVERTEDEEIRKLALKCEERLWIDFLGHLMPYLSHSAGPRSRCYISGYQSAVNSIKLIYLLLGDKCEVKPELPFYSDLLLCPLHCPVYLVDWYLNRKYPHEFTATFEVNSSNDSLPNGKRRGHHEGKPDPGERDPYQEEDLYEYPSTSGLITTYMEDSYALGTATREFHNGQQTDSFLISYKKKEHVETEKDMGCVFTKYIVNDKIPGQPNEYPEFGMKDSGFNTWDMGRKTCFQSENSAMVLYKPKSFASKGVASMRLCLVFPARVCAPVEEIWLGDEKVENYSGSSKEVKSIYVKDGNTYMAFHPMITTNYGREAAIKVEKANDMVLISLYNYQGEVRDFAARGFVLTGNGFACEVRKAQEYGSFEEFRKEMSDYTIEDRFTTNPHVRQTYLRISRYETKNVTLACEYSPVSEGIRYQMVNGELLEETKLQVTDLDLNKVAFLGD